MNYLSNGPQSSMFTMYKRNMYSDNYEFTEYYWYCAYLVRSLVQKICSFSASSEAAHVWCLRDSRSVYSINKFITYIQSSFQEFMQVYIVFSFSVWSSRCHLYFYSIPLKQLLLFFQRIIGLYYTLHNWEIFYNRKTEDFLKSWIWPCK